MTLSLSETPGTLSHMRLRVPAVAPLRREVFARTTFATPSKPISSCLEPDAGRATPLGHVDVSSWWLGHGCFSCLCCAARCCFSCPCAGWWAGAAEARRVMRRLGCAAAVMRVLCLGAECGAASPRGGCHSDLTRTCRLRGAIRATCGEFCGGVAFALPRLASVLQAARSASGKLHHWARTVQASRPTTSPRPSPRTGKCRSSYRAG